MHPAENGPRRLDGELLTHHLEQESAESIQGRELDRGYGNTFVLDPCYDLRVHRADSTVVLEYASEGKVVTTGRPYGNRYICVVTMTDRKITHWRDYLDPLAVFDALGWPTH